MSHGYAESTTPQPGRRRVRVRTDNPARIRPVFKLQQAGGRTVAEPWNAVPA